MSNSCGEDTFVAAEMSQRSITIHSVCIPDDIYDRTPWPRPQRGDIHQIIFQCVAGSSNIKEIKKETSLFRRESSQRPSKPTLFEFKQVVQPRTREKPHGGRRKQDKTRHSTFVAPEGIVFAHGESIIDRSSSE
jgi:hypothetical protein